MISVQQVSKQYGQLRAVDNISFEVKEHEVLVLLGTSGCGKTTTLKMLNRLIEPDSGTILIDSQPIENRPVEELRRSIGYVMQNTGLFPHYTVAQNIAVVPRLLKWDRSKITERTKELISKLHLPSDCFEQYPNQLSGGQQQRVGLARALIANPPVLLMDEPFGALDTVTRTKIQQEFKALDELKQKTIIMVTHDVQEAFDLADRICLMDKGRIVQIGTPRDLLRRPTTAFVTEFLNAHRLQLEFKSITLDQLWPLLTDISTITEVPTVPVGLNLWQSMEKMRALAAPALTIVKKDEKKTVTFEQLTSAFNQYQNSPVQ